MGCASSKIDDLPAIILCRERLDFLSQALHQRYAFAEAHLAYIHSLSTLGVSLRRFFDSSTAIPSPAVVNLPPQRKLQHADDGHGDDDDSGSHLHFHSDSDDDDDDVHALHHDDEDDDDDDGGELHHVRESTSAASPPRGMIYDSGGGGGGPDNNGFGFNPYLYSNGIGYNGGGPNMHMNYMKKHVTPSVSYEQRPVTYETERVQFGDPNAASSSSSNYYDYFGVSGTSAGGPNYNYYNNNNNNNNSIANNNANNGYMNDYGGGFYGAPTANPRGWAGGGGGGPPPPHPQQAKAAPPPPPPPPPATSAWDFMNLFESIDNHYQSYAASRDSREVREEEGIPDLEDEDGYHEHEVVKEVHGNQKLVDDNGHISGSSGSSSSISSSEGRNEAKKEEVVVGVSEGESSLYRARPSASNETAPVEYEVHMVDKNVVGDPGKSENQSKGGGRPVFRNVSEVVHEIQVQFERAAASGNELTKVLEVGKLRYHRKTGAYQVSAKMLNVITPSLPSSSRGEGALEVDEDLQLRSVNLSATLQKLYLWEKKLFEEVKAEEKMRVLHDRKSDKLRHLSDKGAEPQKIESTRNVVRGLSTKIRIAIQVVDKIAVKINKLRDEELWPQLKELIQGLCRMWKAMLECHHNQCEAIDGARGLDAIAFPNNPSDSHLEASLQLEHDLLNWTCRFTEWIGAQKGYVGALNRWLLKCISYEPEETADGIAPFSPGRAGAPPVFVICNQWDQSLERISETSEKELVDAMRVFSMMILHFRERDRGELRQRMTANRDMERKVKTLEKEDIKMQKKMVLASGDTDGGLLLSGNVVYQSDTSSKTSLQAGLRQVFEAMDRFTADSFKAYEELLQRTEEVIREQGRVS